jgi:Transglycosylase
MATGTTEATPGTAAAEPGTPPPEPGPDQPPVRRPGRRRRWWLRWRVLAATAGSVVLLGIGGLVLAYVLIDVPAVNADVGKQATVFLYADGRSELGRVGTFNRIVVPLDRVPPHVRSAVLAAEDRDFYAHSGVSASGLARAVVVNLRGGAVQGGSTITQQYVKNALLSQERTYGRKFQEVFIAVKLERQYSKDQIIERYLNSIYFGRGAYGIQAAAKAYFNKDVRKLSISEGAVLAAVINSPIASDPSRGGQDRLERRWRYVLDGMVRTNALTPQVAAAQRLPRTAPRRADTMAGPRGYLIDAVQRELAGRGFSDAEIETGGLRIVTTIDRGLQRDVESAIDGRLWRRPGIPPGMRIGLIVLGPVQAPILAMYGGPDYLRRPFNDATQVPVPASVPDDTKIGLADMPRVVDIAATRIGPIPFAGRPLAPHVVTSVHDARGRMRYEQDGGFQVARGAQARRIILAGRATTGFDVSVIQRARAISNDRITFGRISSDGRSVAAAAASGRYTLALSLYREVGGKPVRIYDGENLTRSQAESLPWDIFGAVRRNPARGPVPGWR